MQIDGMYIEVFAVKDGIRYNGHIVNIKDVSGILVNSLMDGLQKIVMNEVKGGEKNDE